MEKGLSFLEFNYMIMQSYDFYYLFQHYGCNMQFGGDDQWSNMLGGTELIRRKLGKDAHAMTITLLMNSEGKKMGKTAKRRGVARPEQDKPLRLLPVLAQRRRRGRFEVHPYADLPAARSRSTRWTSGRAASSTRAKEILAYELTALVHGEEEAKKAENAAKALLAARAATAPICPTTVLADADFENGGINILSLLVATGLCPSRGEARRLVQQGGIVVDEKKVESIDESIPQEKFAGDGIIIRKGKKVFHKAVTK